VDTWNVRAKFQHPVDDGDDRDLPPFSMRVALRQITCRMLTPCFGRALFAMFVLPLMRDGDDCL
jgi:hypothetical protein